MLQEIEGIRQIFGEGRRRWFSNRFFQLIVWYKKESDEFLGFQLCYDIADYHRSLTWKERSGYRHNAVDDNGFSGHPQSPVLTNDTAFDSAEIGTKFKGESVNIDTEIVTFVCGKISDYC